jgi:hypothetical protein
MGGVFNIMNLHVYGYSLNNPVKYVDPDGRSNITSLGDDQWAEVSRLQNETIQYIDEMRNEINDYASGKSKTISNEIRQGARNLLEIDIDNRRDARRLANDLGRIRNNLASKKREDFKFSSDPNYSDYSAYVSSFGKTIYLTQIFFDLPDNESKYSNTKHGILFHEVTHFWRVLATQDYTYDYIEASLLVSNPFFLMRRNAINQSPNMLITPGLLDPKLNANNWSFFFQGYAHR